MEEILHQSSSSVKTEDIDYATDATNLYNELKRELRDIKRQANEYITNQVKSIELRKKYEHTKAYDKRDALYNEFKQYGALSSERQWEYDQRLSDINREYESIVAKIDAGKDKLGTVAKESLDEQKNLLLRSYLENIQNLLTKL